MKLVITNLALWLVALTATLVVVHDTAAVSRIAPVFAICMIGSVMTMRRAVGR
jgi:hypothetical protein